MQSFVQERRSERFGALYGGDPELLESTCFVHSLVCLLGGYEEKISTLQIEVHFEHNKITAIWI